MKLFISKYFSLDNLSIPPVFNQKQIPSLNGLRAVSIIFVLIGHSKFVSNSPVAFIFFERYIANMAFGVQVFFVISGFLITGLLLKEKVQNGFINIKHFYIRRAYRILPVAYLYLIVITLLCVAGILSIHAKDVFCSAIFTTDFLPGTRSWFIGHMWSLSVEEQYYVLWPLILLLIPKKYYNVVIIIVLYNIIIRFYLYYHPNPSNLFLLKGFLSFAPALMAGSIFAVGLFKGWFKHIHKFLIHPLAGLSLLLALLAYLPSTLLFAGLYSVPFDYLVSSIFIAVFLYHIVHIGPGNPLYNFFNHPVMNFIGILSYSIYIWQQPFFAPQFSGYNVNPWWALFPQNFLFVFAAALISYFTIEKAFLRLRKRFH